MKSPLIWFGGKTKIADDIIRLMPRHKCYVEPFGGGASVICAKNPVSSEVFNDIDGDLVNFLMVVRERPEEVAEACNTLPYSRKLFDEWKWADTAQDPFQRAVRWFYLNRSMVAGGNNYKCGWRHGSTVNPAKDLRTACDRLGAFSDRFRNVQIECRDFPEVIEVYDSPDTLFYVEPPYVGRELYYKGGFDEQNHRDLARLLNGIKGKALVSYYEDPLIDELYADWHREYIETSKFSQPQSAGQKRPKAREMLLMNYGAVQQTLSV